MGSRPPLRPVVSKVILSPLGQPIAFLGKMDQEILEMLGMRIGGERAQRSCLLPQRFGYGHRIKTCPLCR